jgi:hypothetical protein
MASATALAPPDVQNASQTSVVKNKQNSGGQNTYVCVWKV